jgi:hypothetical protein
MAPTSVAKLSANVPSPGTAASTVSAAAATAAAATPIVRVLLINVVGPAAGTEDRPTLRLFAVWRGMLRKATSSSRSGAGG